MKLRLLTIIELVVLFIELILTLLSVLREELPSERTAIELIDFLTAKWRQS